jgi:hypothetical protein
MESSSQVAMSRARTALSRVAQVPLTRRALGLGMAGLIGVAAFAPTGRRSAVGRFSAASTVRSHRSFLIYYGSQYDSVPGPYSLVALEDHAGAAAVVEKHPGTTFLCYLSLVEVHSGRAFYPRLQAAGLVGEANPNWPDARFIDVRSPVWRDLLVRELVPRILVKGYRGLFLDTLDSAEALEQRDPVRFGGMIAATGDLVRAIRDAFPSIEIMINRGYAVLPRIVGQFDYLLAESLRGTFGPGAETYRLLSDEDVKWQLARMFEARDRDPGLQLFSLDYWNPNDLAGLARLYAEARSSGLTPYVATPDLTQIVPEPLLR